MGEVTLTVPGEYAEHFRAALVEEIAFDTRGIKSARDSARAARERGLNLDARDEDVANLTRQLARDAALVEQVALDGAGDIEVSTSDAGSLQSICETMAREVVGPQLSDSLGCSPIDDDALEELRDLIAATTWATENAAELHPAAVAQTKEGRD